MDEKCKLLVIDDSRTMFEMVRVSLKSGGFDFIEHAVDSISGINLLKQNKIMKS